jgi:hypothetical protein
MNLFRRSLLFDPTGKTEFLYPNTGALERGASRPKIPFVKRPESRSTSRQVGEKVKSSPREPRSSVETGVLRAP